MEEGAEAAQEEAVPLPGSSGPDAEPQPITEPEPEPEPEPAYLTVDDGPPQIGLPADGSDSSEGEPSLRVGGWNAPSRPMTFADLAAHRGVTVDPGTHFRCVKKAAVRAGFGLDSERLLFLEPGEEIEVLESAVNDRGQTRVRYDGGWTSIESAAGSVLLVNMQPDGAPPPLSQWALAGLAAPPPGQAQGDEHEEELETENPAFPAHLQEMELASRLLAEGDYRAASQCFGAMLYRDPNNDSAARGLRQAGKGMQFLLREETEGWLSGLELGELATPLFEQGFDDVSVLWSLRPKELGKLLRTIGVGGAQAKAMQRAVAAERAKVEAAHAAEAQAAQGTEAAAPQDGGGKRESDKPDWAALPITEWLDSIQLREALAAGLDELGVAMAADLQILEEEDITALKGPLKKVQKVKFQTSLSAVLAELRAAEGDSFDRYWQ